MVTKCPHALSDYDAKEVVKEIGPSKTQEVFFTSIEYGVPYHIISGKRKEVTDSEEVLLVTGIANPKPLKKYLLENSGTYYEILYNDHHIFTIDDWKEIVMRFENIQANEKMILTTEKDAVRLMKFEQALTEMPVYVMPITNQFLLGGENHFRELISKFISEFRKNNK